MSETDDQRDAWHQRILTFDDRRAVEPAAVAHLGPGMKTAEAAGLISGWFFIRKGNHLRLRYRPAERSLANAADDDVENLLTDLQQHAPLVSWVATIYESETYAFGGPKGMDAAHGLFHQDSRNVLDYLGGGNGAPSDKRRELSVLLCSALIRSAGQEWFETGDVWARVADTRPKDSEVFSAT